MEKIAPWWNLFAFARDGITGSELLGIVMVLGMIVIMCLIQYGNRGVSEKLDFAWIFADGTSGKVSRSGLMTFGGFLLGCWVVVDAQSNGKLDWTAFGTFLAYCAGVRAIEAWKPKDDPPSQSLSKRTTVVDETLVGDAAEPPADPVPVRVANKAPIATRDVPRDPLAKSKKGTR